MASKFGFRNATKRKRNGDRPGDRPGLVTGVGGMKTRGWLKGISSGSSDDASEQRLSADIGNLEAIGSGRGTR